MESENDQEAKALLVGEIWQNALKKDLLNKLCHSDNVFLAGRAPALPDRERYRNPSGKGISGGIFYAHIDYALNYIPRDLLEEFLDSDDQGIKEKALSIVTKAAKKDV